MSGGRTALAAFRFELAVIRRSPGDLMALVNTPLLTVMFLSIVRHAERPDLEGFAVLAPAVMSLWSMALLVSGEIVDQDRWSGRLELQLGAPAPFALVIVGRVAAVTLVSLVALLESWAVARVGFGIAVDVDRPALFVGVLLVTALGMASWATAMSATFVLTRSARTFQNSLSYPFFLLGGAFVPVDLLPDALQPLARLVFLSWCSDLLRDAMDTAPDRDVAGRVAIALVLGLAGYLLGHRLLRGVTRRVRATGTAGYA